MKAFISYSHKDENYLDLLTKHLALLKRDGMIQEWTDRAIEAGADFTLEIDSNLSNSELFIALLSPDYINSNYCYEKEFKKALSLRNKGKLKIIPMVVEDCDWLNSPFSEMKALPKDGKAIANWSNKNTAMLDVIQNIRKLLIPNKDDEMKNINILEPTLMRNVREYRVQKDFDSIQKLEFVEEGFNMMRRKLNDNIQEILTIEGLNAKKLKDNDKEFICILVNRNKIKAEATLRLLNSTQEKNTNSRMYSNMSSYFIGYEISNDNNSNKIEQYFLGEDDFEMFWNSYNFAGFSSQPDKRNINEIVENCWNSWLHAIGITY